MNNKANELMDEWMSMEGSERGEVHGNQGVLIPASYVDDKGDWDIALNPTHNLEDKIILDLVTTLIKMGRDKEAMDKLYDYAVATNRINRYAA